LAAIKDELAFNTDGGADGAFRTRNGHRAKYAPTGRSVKCWAWKTDAGKNVPPIETALAERDADPVLFAPYNAAHSVHLIRNDDQVELSGNADRALDGEGSASVR
jgi:hypothetical protein